MAFSLLTAFSELHKNLTTYWWPLRGRFRPLRGRGQGSIPGAPLLFNSDGQPSFATWQPWPERSGPREIGIHHAGAELEPAKGNSGVITLMY